MIRLTASQVPQLCEDGMKTEPATSSVSDEEKCDQGIEMAVILQLVRADMLSLMYSTMEKYSSDERLFELVMYCVVTLLDSEDGTSPF